MTILSYVSSEAHLSIGFVYCWTNLINGIKYIGSHNGRKPTYKGSGRRFREAVKEFGIKSFSREIIYCGPHYLSVEKEILMAVKARQSDNFYNMINKASEGFLHKTTRDTPETRAKKSAAQKRRYQSQEERDKAAERSRGRIVSKETRVKMSESNRGQKRSEETKAKISAKAKGRVVSDETKAKISAFMSGENNPNRGKKQSEETKAKQRAIQKKIYESEEAREKQRNAQKGKLNIGPHNAWHVNRGKVNLNCIWCIKALEEK